MKANYYLSYAFLANLLIFPLAYYKELQLIGLAAPRIFPSINVFQPGSSFCAYPSLQAVSNMPKYGLAQRACSLVLSPIALLLSASYISPLLDEARDKYLPTATEIRDRLIQPRNVNNGGAEVAPIVPRDRRPLLTRTLAFLGWGFTLPRVRLIEEQSTESHPAHTNEPREVTASQTSNPNSIETTDRDHESPHFRPYNATEGHETQSADAATPLPRVTISNREPGTLTVELEIETTSESVVPHSSNEPANAQTIQTKVNNNWTGYLSPHRVNRFSRGPAKLLSRILSEKVTTIVNLPLDIFVYRSCAFYFSYRAAGHTNPWILVRMWQAHIRSITWRSSAVFLQRMAFIMMLDLTVSLAAWGLHYVLTVYAGKKWFNWGGNGDKRTEVVEEEE
jgi:hypothetical protein